jgi:hypothetical protein
MVTTISANIVQVTLITGSTSFMFCGIVSIGLQVDGHLLGLLVSLRLGETRADNYEDTCMASKDSKHSNYPVYTLHTSEVIA